MLVRLGKNAPRALLAAIGALGLGSCAAQSEPGTASIASPPADVATQAVPERRAIPTPSRPLGSFPAAHTSAPQPVIDLTADGAVAWGTIVPEVIDTRTVHPQISTSPWNGEVQAIKNGLPKHARPARRPLGQDNSLPVGAVGAEEVARPGALFPGISQTPWQPPDPTLAVGRDHIVETVNMVVAFFTKSGTMQFSQNLDSDGNPGFFETIGGGDFTFDPKCFYDHLSDRFLIVALEVYGSTEAWISIAISDDGDPNGVWYKYRTNAVITVGATTYWWDYPGFGYDGQGYYVTGNLFGLNNGGWAGVGFRVFNKAQMVAGLPVSFSTLRDGNGASCQVAQHFGLIQTPFFVSVESTTQLRINSIKNPITAPTLSTTFVTIPIFNWLGGGAPNLGGTVDTIDERIFNVVWRGGNMFAAHNIYAGNKNVARWYHLRTNSWPTSGSVVLHQSGNIDAGGGVHSFFPAIYTNRCADAGLVLGTSSSSTTPDIRVTGRKTNDPLGQMGVPITVFTSPTGTSGRWGDYFDMAVDPVDDTRFWFVGEYKDASGWGTYIGSFLVSCPADFNCDGFVDGIDSDQFNNAFESGDITADYNHDGFVDGIDSDMFNNDFETPCP